MLYCLSLLETEEQKTKFTAIYDRNRDKMYHIAFRFLGQKEEAENAVHDAFMKLADYFGRYEHLSEKQMDGLCVTVVKNTAIDLLYRQKKTAALEPEEMEAQYWKRGGESICFPEEAAIEKEEAEIIRKLLEELPIIYHDILVLRYYYDFSVKETAKILGLSKRTAEMRLYRAKERLRKVLHEKGIQHIEDAG